MIHKTTTTLAALFFFIAVGMAQNLPALDAVWSGALPKDTMIAVMNNIYPRAELTVDGVKYYLAVDRKTRQVKFIVSYDEHFRLNGKSIVGQPNSSFKGRNNYIPGWANYIQLENNWYASFPFQNLKDSSKCVSVFKYRFH